ncbi:MAG: hypothetical protein IID40_04490 [Planctomycetes bacterium]|nr:hypothetical protein [Planctomycetota bacterium]
MAGGFGMLMLLALLGAALVIVLLAVALGRRLRSGLLSVLVACAIGGGAVCLLLAGGPGRVARTPSASVTVATSSPDGRFAITEAGTSGVTILRSRRTLEWEGPVTITVPVQGPIAVESQVTAPPTPLAETAPWPPGRPRTMPHDRTRVQVERPGIRTVLAAVVLAVMIFLAYLFLDSGTRGQFTWPLRIFSALAFVGICVALALFGHGL